MKKITVALSVLFTFFFGAMTGVYAATAAKVVRVDVGQEKTVNLLNGWELKVENKTESKGLMEWEKIRACDGVTFIFIYQGEEKYRITGNEKKYRTIDNRKRLTLDSSPTKMPTIPYMVLTNYNVQANDTYEKLDFIVYGHDRVEVQARCGEDVTNYGSRLNFHAIIRAGLDIGLRKVEEDFEKRAEEARKEEEAYSRKKKAEIEIVESLTRKEKVVCSSAMDNCPPRK